MIRISIQAFRCCFQAFGVGVSPSGKRGQPDPAVGGRVIRCFRYELVFYVEDTTMCGKEAVKLGAVDEIVPLPGIPQALISVLKRDGKPRQCSRKGG
jgi:hypothetical protein